MQVKVFGQQTKASRAATGKAQSKGRSNSMPSMKGKTDWGASQADSTHRGRSRGHHRQRQKAKSADQRRRIATQGGKQNTGSALDRGAQTSHECLSRFAQGVGLVGVQLGVGASQLSLVVEGG